MKLTLEKAKEIMADNNGNLYLMDTNYTELPDNLTVGESIYLNNTPITSLPDNIKVGSNVYSDRTKIPPNEFQKVKKLQEGDYVPGRYLYADGILTLVKGKKQIKGYTFYKGKIPGFNVVYDGKYYAHCKTLKEGIADLLFKKAKDRGAGQYKGITLDSELKAEEMITMYRVITGACKPGTEYFVSSLGKLKDSYTVREAIEITRGQYQSEIFRKFFEV